MDRDDRAPATIHSLDGRHRPAAQPTRWALGSFRHAVRVDAELLAAIVSIGALISGVVLGWAGIVIGPRRAAGAAAEADLRRWHREKRAELYIDLMASASRGMEALEIHLEPDAFERAGRTARLIPAVLTLHEQMDLAARMGAYASAAMNAAHDRFKKELALAYDGPKPATRIDPDEPPSQFVGVLVAMVAMRDQIRSEVGSEPMP